MNADRPVRVRFAPSPTGYLHVGGARTALYNFLFARKHHGKFILRIEDTDRSRYVPDSVDDIMASLRWLGITWDEGPDVGGPYGPYVQSQRVELYRQYTHQLVEQGHAYYCFCSEERLQSLREMQRRLKLRTGYDRKCRNLSPEEVQKNLDQQVPYVIRLKVPLEGSTTFHDLLRGDITYPNSELEDIILLKSDGFPTYHLANVVDDHLMEISHVLRADEWIPSTPYHQLLYQAFGWDPPIFAHLPVILSPDGKGKLSKRHGATAVREFREQGYLPEALVNFLALLGWSPGSDREIVSLEEMIELFDLKKVGKRGAVFDYQKLLWMNGEYIRSLTDEELYQRALPYMEAAGLIQNDADREKFRAVVPLIKERIKTLAEAPDHAEFFYREPETYDEKGLRKHLKDPGVFHRLRLVVERLQALDDFTVASVEQTIRGLAEELGVGAGKLIHPTRLAVTGRTRGPGLFELMAVLGKETCIRRIQKFIQRFEGTEVHSTTP